MQIQDQAQEKSMNKQRATKLQYEPSVAKQDYVQVHRIILQLQSATPTLTRTPGDKKSATLCTEM